MKFEAARIHFLSDVFAAVAVAVDWDGNILKEEGSFWTSYRFLMWGRGLQTLVQKGLMNFFFVAN